MNNDHSKLTQDRQLSAIISRYNAMVLRPGENAELEIRFLKITKNIFLETYGEFVKEYGAPEVTKSIVASCGNPFSVADAGPTRYNQIQNYSVSPPQKEYQSKHVEHPPVIIRGGFLEYKINLAKEVVVKPFPICDDAVVRFKVRASFTAGPWRFDFTAIRSGSFQELRGSLAALKSSLMSAPKSKDVFDKIDLSLISSFEIEIEHLGGGPGARIPLKREDMSVVGKVMHAASPVHAVEQDYQAKLQSVVAMVLGEEAAAKYASPQFRQRRFLPQVIGLTAATYYGTVYPPWGFYATIKADGYRALCLVGPEGCTLILSDSLKFYPRGKSEEKSGNQPSKMVVADCELVGEHLMVFDVLYLGESVVQRSIEERLALIPEAVSEISRAYPGVTAKKIVALGGTAESVRAAIEELRAAPKDYPDDGIILMRGSRKYFESQNYKWKPREQLTVDFLCRRAPDSFLGRPPYSVKPGRTLYLLFVGISRGMRASLGISPLAGYSELFPVAEEYAPIQFSPSIAPYAYLWYSPRDDLDGAFVELGPGGETNQTEVRSCTLNLVDWTLHKIREDRKNEHGYYGNNWPIAEETVTGYWDTLTLEGLWERPESYFMKTVDPAVRAGNKLRRFTISRMLAQEFTGTETVVDLAAGQGADLASYAGLGVKHLLCVDIDSAAIGELIRRKFIIFSKSRAHKGPTRGGSQPLTLHTLVANLKLPVGGLLAEMCQFGIVPGSAGGVVCNFAIHYFCDTLGNITNFLELVSSLLKPKGKFEFTTMDGAKIFAALKDIPAGSSWELRDAEESAAKYRITREYSGDELAPVGQTISLKLPFTDEPRREPLCNISTVLSIAKGFGMKVRHSSVMDALEDEFTRVKPSIAQKLSPADRQYTALHTLVILEKI